MTNQSDAVVRVNNPAQFLSIIPSLVGFNPADSLVIVGYKPPRDRVGVTLRYNLPDDTGLVPDIIGHAMAVLSDQDFTGFLAVIYGSDEGPVAAFLAAALIAAADGPNPALLDVFRVEGDRYWSYTCTEPQCCPVEGTPFAITPTPLGTTVLTDRAELAASIAPVTGEAAEAMRQATRRAEQRLATLTSRADRAPSTRQLAGRLIVTEGLAITGTLIDAYRADRATATDDQVARLTMALRDLRVRDDAWARMDPEHRAAHLRLWADVTRRAQPGYVTAPAALLAFCAWQDGNGALANVALDRALADDPDYSMAQLLRQTLAAGAPPSLARLPMSPSQVAASYAEMERDESC
jgi:uncharacterized protein DUF4192